VSDFLQHIYRWYNQNKRSLPWRETSDPYKIWISEIILQQTRVEQGWAYYQRFTEKFPSIDDLASASEDQVLKLWQGLGYYSRARNLHESAKIIKTKHHGLFPQTYTEILSLKGIGPYTAAAVASIAFNLPHPVLDGNVYRFLSRYFGISLPVNSATGKKRFQKIASDIMPPHNPGYHNEALMEFGALQCTPRSPACTDCPVSSSCYAFGRNKVLQLPVKEKKSGRRMRYFYYYLVERGDFIWLEKRTGNDIWKNLYQFPAVETLYELSLEEAALLNPSFLNGTGYSVKSISEARKHVLSHQILFARLVHLNVNIAFKPTGQYLEVHKNDFHNYPVPRLVEQLAKKSKILNY
jgi:A/G-specific adenine glycosylase